MRILTRPMSPNLAPAGRALVILLSLAAACARADTLIDDFEGANAPSPWTFSNGPEFPGAVGAFTLGAGRSGGHSGQLAYDLSLGGSYTAAYLTLPAPLTAAAIGFWVKSPSNVEVVLRVVDTSGQTLQYNLSRPVESMDPGSWYQQVVELDAPSLWFGGANDGSVHNPIVSIGLLATNNVQSKPKGSLNFDDVYAVSSTAFSLNPAVPLIAPNPGTGDLLSGMGVVVHSTNDTTELDAARAAGFSWVRTDLSWSAIETSAGSYGWGAYDGLVSLLKARGMRPLFILDYGNALYTGLVASPPTTPAAVTAYANFAQAAAAHFAGTGARFEVWNEPNLSVYWPPTPSASQYAALAAAAIPAVHKGDPGALVTTGGLSGFDFDFAQPFLAANGGVGANAFGVQPYDVTDAPGELTEFYTNLQSTLSQAFTSAPAIWATEWGYTSTDYSAPGTANGNDPSAERVQAALVAKELLSAYAVGLPLYVYNDLLDDGTDPGYRPSNYGLLATNYSDKPAMTAVKQLAAVVSGRKFSGFIHTAPSSLVAMRFDGPGDSVVALWSFARNSSVAVTLVGTATARDVVGAPLALPGGALTVSDSGGPVYVTFTGSAWLKNLSARAFVKGGQNLLIAGFVTTGTADKTLLIRGDGPSLSAFSIADFLADPQLTFSNSAGTIDSAVSWDPSLQSSFTKEGAFQFAAGSKDTALLESVTPNAYTAQVGSATTGSGVALAEIYEADSGAPANRLVNISARALVGTDFNVLIGGFVVGGNADETLLIRGDGPVLSAFGLTGVLANPVLTLLDSNGATIASNTGWGNPSVLGSAAVASGPTETLVQPATAAIFSRAGAFALPSGSADSAFVVTLPPGNYTAQVSGANATTGLGLVEIYEVK